MDRYLSNKYTSDELYSNNESSSSAIKCPVKKNKFRFNCNCDKSYLNYGFNWTGDEILSLLLCLACGCKMSNKLMLPSKLRISKCHIAVSKLV